MSNNNPPQCLPKKPVHLRVIASVENVAGDRRYSPDRRRLSFSAMLHGCCHPRRTRIRRHTGTRVPLLDVYATPWLLCVGLILLLSASDALFTAYLLSNGAEELNPVMKGLIEVDARLFALCKILLTGTACATLLSISEFPLARFARLRVRHVLYVVLGGYSSLIAYELWMMHFLMQ